MQGGRGQYAQMVLIAASSVRLALVVALTGFLTIGFAPPAAALPSFARQTGQPCGACHTDFAGLTPYGRRFKIGGYTYGGGPYRTTLFPSADDSPPSNQKHWVPPISMMAIVGFTHTEADQPPPTAPLSTNNNTLVSPVSFFWGGAITDHIGAFAQLTDTGPPTTASIGTDPTFTTGPGTIPTSVMPTRRASAISRYLRHHRQ